MAKEKPESELKRLLKEQDKARQDEVFGGLLPAERSEYEGKAERIHALESEIQASVVAKKSSQSALRLISPTAAEKKIRRTALPIREGSGQRQKALEEKGGE